MSVKKKLGMGIAAGVLGVSLLGGTWAAFSDKEVLADNDMVAGTLDLLPEMENRALFEVTNLAPGDTMKRELSLRNGGTIDIKEVFLTFENTLTDVASPTGVPIDSNNKNTLLDDIKISIFKRDNTNPVRAYNPDTQESKILTHLTLAELEALTKTGNWDISGSKDNNNVGLAANGADVDKFIIELTYVDQGNQNHQQGDAVSLSLTFDATQRDGVQRDNNDGTPVGDGDLVTD